MKKRYIILLVFLISLISLTIVSKNSFLYAFNDWVDAHSFMTVARGWMNDLLPYKDLFEQKGPLLFLIYVIGNMISKKSFIGIFILEIISFSIFLYYIYKIINKYLNDKLSFIILILFSSILLSSKAFFYGGSAEEFILPLLGIILYYFNNFLDSKSISKKEIFISGIMTGLIFNIKFNLIGFSFIFMFMIDLYFLIKKDIKKCIILSLLFLLGMFLPILIFGLYFYINNGLNEYINAYILYNTYTYGVSISLFRRIYDIVYALVVGLYNNYFIIPFYLVSLFTFILSKKLFKDIYSKFSIVLFIIMGCIGIYFNTRFYFYYFLPVMIFSIYGFIYIVMLLDKYISKKYYLSIIIVFIISFGILMTSRNISSIKLDKKDLVQYRYADIIKDKRLLNYGSLDGGFYYTSNTLPVNRYFHKLNGMSDEMNKEVEESIKKKDYDYIVYRSLESNCDKEFNGYKLIRSDSQYLEGMKFYYYLFELEE